MEAPHKDDDSVAPPTTRTRQTAGPVYSLDASWHKEDNLFGRGMVLTTEDGMMTFGSFASNRVLTLLHVDFQTLL